MKKKISTNLIFGVVSILCGIVLLCIIPFQVKTSTMVEEYVNGSFIPILMAVIMIICGIFGLIKSLMLKEEGTREIELPIEAKSLGFLLIVLIYGLFCNNVSFLIGSILFAFISLFYIGCRDWKKYGIVIITVVAVSLIFKFGLKVQFGGLLGI